MSRIHVVETVTGAIIMNIGTDIGRMLNFLALYIQNISSMESNEALEHDVYVSVVLSFKQVEEPAKLTFACLYCIESVEAMRLHHLSQQVTNIRCTRSDRPLPMDTFRDTRMVERNKPVSLNNHSVSCWGTFLFSSDL